MFSKNYYKYLLKNNRALILTIVLVLALNVLMTSAELGQGFSFGFGLFLCYALPILTFKFVHDNKAVDTYYSLPINRKALLITGLIYCVSLIVVPYLFANLFIVLFKDGSILLQEILTNCLTFIGLIVFNLYFYLAANNNVDGIVVLGAYTVLPLALYLFVTIFCEIFICGYSYVESEFFEYLSPLANGIVTYMNVDGIRVFITCLYILLFIVLLIKSFTSRKVERAGKASNNILAYPTLINVYVLLILSSISFGFAKYNNLLEFLSDNFILYLLVFILYISFNFIYKRKFYIDIKMPIYFIAIIVVSLICSKIIFANEAFGLSNVHQQYDKDTMYQMTIYNYNQDNNEVKKWVESKTQESTSYFEVVINASSLKGLDENVVNTFEEYRSEAIKQFYQTIDNQESSINLYVYPNYENFNNIFRNSYSYTILNKNISIDELIELASYDDVTVKFETDLKEYQLNKKGELVRITYNEETIGIEY